MRVVRRSSRIALVAVTAAAILVGPVAVGGAAGAAPGINAGTVAGLTIDPDTVVAGTPAVGTVTLTAVSGSDTVVALSSTDTTVITVPPTMTVPARAISATFPVTTIPFTGPGNFGCVFGRAGGGEGVDCLNVNPLPSGPRLNLLTFSPNPVIGGAPATGTVGFASVTDGALVTLVSDNPAVASVPAETFVSGGQSRGSFPVTTAAVAVDTPVLITATGNGTSRSTTLTVRPGTPPAADTVRITRAEWRRGILRIEATSTNRNAILSVYLTVSNSFMFELNNLGNGRYSIQRSWLDNPRRITVRSNFGGEATANL